MTKPNISVVIPCYNAEPWVSMAIRSALAQDGVKVEVVVVDDGSTDASLSIMEMFRDQIEIISQANQGACVARNVGIKTARGLFIKFLDADDYLLPGALQAQYAHALTLSPNQFSYGRILRHVESDGYIIPHGPRDMWPDNRDLVSNMLMDPPQTMSMLYPVEMMQELDGFDERLVKRQDYDLFARALLAGYCPVACKATIGAYRSHDNINRISRRFSREAFTNQAEMFEKQISLLEEAGESRDVDELRIGLAATVWVTARNCLRTGHKNEAWRMFRLSDALAGRRGQQGKFPYKLLVSMFGPVTAEGVISKVKALRHWP